MSTRDAGSLTADPAGRASYASRGFTDVGSDADARTDTRERVAPRPTSG